MMDTIAAYYRIRLITAIVWRYAAFGTGVYLIIRLGS